MDKDMGPVVAVHYIYMLKEGEDLQKVWGVLSEGTSTVESESLSLGLSQGMGHHHHRGCTVVSRASGDRYNLCLAMLPDLAAIQIVYRGSGGIDADWKRVLAQIDSDKERATGDATVMGETTLLVAPEIDSGAIVDRADAALPAGHMLLSEIDPAIAGGDKPLLGYLLAEGHTSRDYFVLSAESSDSVAESLFPEADSYIKKLNKTSKYFSHQRQTIIKERARVDEEVGSILHEQVVSGNGSFDAEKLEEEITSLSRMFGVLATDSQLVRQAAERIEKDMHRLDFAMSPLRISGNSRDEIKEHFTSKYNAEYANARAESESLDFSRTNAQAAIEVVRTQVDLLRAGEEAALQTQTKGILDRSLSLQEERLALQVAAGFIEFVLVFYYVLKSWETIVGKSVIEHTSPLLVLSVVGGIAFGTALGTHYLASAIHNRKTNRGVLVSVLIIVLSLAGLVTLTVIAD